jgi:hypothetical protein
VTLLFGLCLLLVVALPLALAIHRATELFVAEVRSGELRLRRGRAPARLVADLEDVVADAEDGAIRVVVEDGRPRALVSGALASHAQIIRNVVGTWSVAKIRSGRRA